MGSRWIAAVGVALTVLVTAGCAQASDGRYYPNRTDWARAQAIWSDPWIAASETTTAGAGPTAHGTQRMVASDSGTIRGSRAVVRKAELAAATAQGWRLVGNQCHRDFTLFFAKGSATAGDQARATITYAYDRGVTDTGTDKTALWTRQLTVEVPQHFEDPWPDQPTITLTDNCSDEAPDEPALAYPSGQPEPVPDWPTAASNQAIAQLSATANTDPFLTTLGITVGGGIPAIDAPSYAMTLPQGSSDDLPADTTLPDLVTTATSDGYTLTFASCGLGRTLAVLRKPLPSPDGATLSVRLAAEPSDATHTSLTARALVSLPELAGPPTTATAVSSPCWDARTSQQIVAQGNPWFGPTTLQRTNTD